MNKVLIIDDDKELCALMKKCIEQEKLSAVTVYNGIEGVRLIDENKDSYSLIILDVMLPDIDGFQILQKIRDTSNIPVLMLTAKSSEEDKVFGLRLGADDYLTKPFGINELLARVNSLIRRYTTLNPFTADIDSISLKDMVIDKLNRTVTVKDIPVLLTGKEFDLLRFGDNYIINIEIKTESSIDKIFKQQQKNKYYLEFLNKEIYIYTYILNENKLYKLIRKDSNNEIKEATFNELCNKLLLQEVVTFNNIDDLFNPSDYLVSPFNSPEKFMAEGYFLTVQQEQIYNEIRTKLSDATTKFIALTGSAGTGKTLLTYHIAKESIRKGEKVLILHCAPLNSGHKILMEEYGWSIHMPKYAPNTTDFDLIIIDEAQRMYPYQFDKYIEEVRTFNKKCIFSYDENQYLRDNEKNYHTKERIEKELSCTPYKLTDKIRTNKEIAYFIRQLFNLKKNISNIDYPNIELTYCKNYFSAKSLLQELSKKNWKVPNYTPGTRSTFHYEAYLSGDTECAHSVVGQEFDNVVIVIDDSFKYNSQGDLIADNTYYSQRQMLYQIITRTRKKLHIVIIDNEVMLDRCIDILNK